jgi:isopenicillin-N epimerase
MTGEFEHLTPRWGNLWELNPEIAYLNHGAFGACPRSVLAYQQQLQRQMEQEPLQFILQLEGLLDTARQQLATFLGAQPENLVFVPNATTGVNTVLRSLQFQAGDELVITDHGYNACCNALEFVAQRSGTNVVVAAVPFPIASPDQVIDAVLAAVSPRTQLVLLDHVSSPTGLIFPVAQLMQALSDQGIDTLIDGAHATGMVPLNLDAMGAAYYTGNCHKWLCAPKGAAFLHVRRDRQDRIRPLVISHGANSPRDDRSRFWLEFDWVGTDDPTPYLAIPEAIRFMGSLLPGGWSALMAHNHQQILRERDRLCQTLHCQLPSPDEMIGAMASVPLPEKSPEPLQSILFEKFGIEVPVFPWPPSATLRSASLRSQPIPLMRICAQIYNTPEHFQRLRQALTQLGVKN